MQIQKGGVKLDQSKKNQHRAGKGPNLSTGNETTKYTCLFHNFTTEDYKEAEAHTEKHPKGTCVWNIYLKLELNDG